MDVQTERGFNELLLHPRAGIVVHVHALLPGIAVAEVFLLLLVIQVVEDLCPVHLLT